MRIIFAICHNTYFRKLCKSDVFLFYFTWCFILVVCVACNLHLITHTKRWTYPINHKCSPWRTNMAIGSIEWRLFQPKQCKQQTQQSRSREAIVVKVSVLFELVNLSLFFLSFIKIWLKSSLAEDRHLCCISHAISLTNVVEVSCWWRNVASPGPDYFSKLLTVTWFGTKKTA